MNGEVCCILAVCCPPGSQKQNRALVTELVKAGVCDEEYAPKVATWILKNFDLAPAGTLTDFKAALAKLARAKE